MRTKRKKRTSQLNALFVMGHIQQIVKLSGVSVHGELKTPNSEWNSSTRSETVTQDLITENTVKIPQILNPMPSQVSFISSYFNTNFVIIYLKTALQVAYYLLAVASLWYFHHLQVINDKLVTLHSRRPLG